MVKNSTMISPISRGCLAGRQTPFQPQPGAPQCKRQAYYRDPILFLAHPGVFDGQCRWGANNLNDSIFKSTPFQRGVLLSGRS